MKYGLMTYEDTYRGTNIGDYIQSIAACQFLPNVDTFINREHLNEYAGGKTKIILNGWFTHHPENWPPSDSILPLFVAFHVNSSHAEKLLSNKGIDYLKRYEPIGCRDEFTASILKDKNIKSYFSGCLTLTLDKYKVSDAERSDKIYIVDPIFNLYSFRDAFTSFRFFLAYLLKGRFIQSFKRHKLIRTLIPKQIRKKAIYRHHMLFPNKYSENKRFEIAENLLHEYARAKCVITSRIHCALPCLALGTPVIFINSFEDNSNRSRLAGLAKLFNTINVDISTNHINSSDIELDVCGITESSIIPNKKLYLTYADYLKQKVREFVEADEPQARDNRNHEKNWNR